MLAGAGPQGLRLLRLTAAAPAGQSAGDFGLSLGRPKRAAAGKPDTAAASSGQYGPVEVTDLVEEVRIHGVNFTPQTYELASAHVVSMQRERGRLRGRGAEGPQGRRDGGTEANTHKHTSSMDDLCAELICP